MAEARPCPDEAWLQRFWLKPLLDALAVMHAAQCYHRDIAPDNILLTRRGPLLLDFGAARRVIGDMTHALTVILKPGYAPIEQYGDVASMAQGAWTDLYALACVVYYAITGKTPMSSVERLMDDRLEPLSVSMAGRYSPAFLRAIDAALAVRPADRPQNEPQFRAMLDADQPAASASGAGDDGAAGVRLLDRAGDADARALDSADAAAAAGGRACAGRAADTARGDTGHVGPNGGHAEGTYNRRRGRRPSRTSCRRRRLSARCRASRTWRPGRAPRVRAWGCGSRSSSASRSAPPRCSGGCSHGPKAQRPDAATAPRRPRRCPLRNAPPRPRPSSRRPRLRHCRTSTRPQARHRSMVEAV